VCTDVTDRQETTDGRTTTYSERERNRERVLTIEGSRRVYSATGVPFGVHKNFYTHLLIKIFRSVSFVFLKNYGKRYNSVQHLKTNGININISNTRYLRRDWMIGVKMWTFKASASHPLHLQFTSYKLSSFSIVTASTRMISDVVISVVM